MTKTTTVPHLLEQLSVELSANGERIDTAYAYGVPVMLHVSFQEVGERNDEAHFVIEKIVTTSKTASLFADGFTLDIMGLTNITSLIPKSQVAAIEENLLAQMAGE